MLFQKSISTTVLFFFFTAHLTAVALSTLFASFVFGILFMTLFLRRKSTVSIWTGASLLSARYHGSVNFYRMIKPKQKKEEKMIYLKKKNVVLEFII